MVVLRLRYDMADLCICLLGVSVIFCWAWLELCETLETMLHTVYSACQAFLAGLLC